MPSGNPYEAAKRNTAAIEDGLKPPRTSPLAEASPEHELDALRRDLRLMEISVAKIHDDVEILRARVFTLNRDFKRLNRSILVALAAGLVAAIALLNR